MSQTKLAYVGAAIIVAGAATMMYAPEIFYQGDAQLAASAVVEHALQSDTEIVQAAKP